MIDEKLELLAKSLFGFIKKKRKFDRDPRIEYKFDDDNANKFLGKTGYYDPDSEHIVIFCTNRHPKDILRSLAHELIHHIQNCEGRMDSNEMGSATDENYIVHNKFLKQLEEEAFLEGNLDLREWEAFMRDKKRDPMIKEKKENKHTKAQIDKVHDRAAKIEKGSDVPTDRAFKIAWSQLKKGELEETEIENLSEGLTPVVNQEVTIINPALKDSVVYNPDDRACNDLYSKREELVYQELLKKFGIKK